MRHNCRGPQSLKEYVQTLNPEVILLRSLSDGRDTRRAIEMFACLLVEYGIAFAYDDEKPLPNALPDALPEELVGVKLVAMHELDAPVYRERFGEQAIGP
jgi:hypothetical protein